MRQPPFVVLVAIATLAGAPRSVCAQTHPVSLQDLLSIRQVSGPELSPDGRSLLYVVRQWEDQTGKNAGKKESRTHVWRVNADGTGQRQLTFDDRGESAPAWSPDGTWISFLSARADRGSESGDDPHAQVWLMRADGGEAWRLTDAAQSVASYAWSPDSTTIAYVAADAVAKDVQAQHKRGDDEKVFEGDFRMAHLWIVGVAPNVATGGAARTEMHPQAAAATELVHDPHLTIRGEPSWSADGRRVAFAAAPTPLVRDSRSDVYIAPVGGGVEKITANPGPDGSPAWSPDGRTIAYLSTPSASKPLGDGIPIDPLGNEHLMLYDVASRRATDAARRDFDLSPGRPYWTADSSRLFFDAGAKAYSDLFAYDVAGRTYTRMTTGKVARIGSVGRTGLGLVIESSSAPAEVFLMQPAAGGRLTKLTDTNPQARGLALGRTEVVSWKSDAFTIEGVLLKPVDYQPGRRYPLLVVPHGGPTGAYLDSYWVGYGDGGQNWAGEGWAVLYPNPRGSTNYGEAFERANVDDWGGGDYRDVMSGVDAMVARGIADPDKLAILGWSYGGYMTCWTITQTPRFKAAMIGAGLTNLVSMYGTNDSSNYLAAFFGGTPNATTLALYRSRSGFTFVDRVTTPVLILHGGSDERVPIGQPMEFYRALRDRGKTAELVFYPREGHGFREVLSPARSARAAACLDHALHARRPCEHESPVTESSSIAANTTEALTTLFALGREVTSVLDLDELLQKIPRLIARLTSFHAFAVYLLDGRGSELHVAYSVGYPPASARMRLKVGQGLVGTAVAEGRPLLVNDVHADSRYVEAVPGSQAELVVPLRRQGRVIGALNLLSSTAGQFTETDEAILRQFAAHVAVAIENARLFEHEREYTGTLETLSEIAREFGAILNLDELLTRIANLTRRVIDYRTFGILLLNHDTGELEMKVAVRYGDKVTVPRVKLGHGLVGYAALHKAPVVVPDVNADPRYIRIVEDARSELVIPLLLQDRCIGVFDLESPELDAFTTRHVQILTLLASQAAVAIENARLYETIQTNEVRLEKEIRFAQRVQAALLPAELPKRLKAVDVAARFAPARELGGDLYDFLAPEPHSLVVAVGDVSGKGVPAALYSAFAGELVRSRTFRRRYAPERFSPSGVLASMNTILHERQLEEYYCTLCYAVFDLKRRTVTMANSGLPYPIRCSGDRVEQVELPGVPLGSFAGSTYDEVTFDLAAGDLFVFCSDGVFEANDAIGREFGAARLLKVVTEKRHAQAREIVDAIFDAVQEFRGDTPPNDDMTAVALRVAT